MADSNATDASASAVISSSALQSRFASANEWRTSSETPPLPVDSSVLKNQHKSMHTHDGTTGVPFIPNVGACAGQNCGKCAACSTSTLVTPSPALLGRGVLPPCRPSFNGTTPGTFTKSMYLTGAAVLKEIHANDPSPCLVSRSLREDQDVPPITTATPLPLTQPHSAYTAPPSEHSIVRVAAAVRVYSPSMQPSLHAHSKPSAPVPRPADNISCDVTIAHCPSAPPSSGAHAAPAAAANATDAPAHTDSLAAAAGVLSLRWPTHKSSLALAALQEEWQRGDSHGDDHSDSALSGSSASDAASAFEVSPAPRAAAQQQQQQEQQQKWGALSRPSSRARYDNHRTHGSTNLTEEFSRYTSKSGFNSMYIHDIAIFW